MSPSFTFVAIADVWAMLKQCSPTGFTVKKTQHHFRVTANGRMYPALPLGKHGASRGTDSAEVELGHVRKMARWLLLEICSDRFFANHFR